MPNFEPQIGGWTLVPNPFFGGVLFPTIVVVADDSAHLTPQTFAAALRSTTFPNPGAGTSPSYQARVGFAGGSHTMVHDFAAFWLNQSNNDAFSTVAPFAAISFKSPSVLAMQCAAIRSGARRPSQSRYSAGVRPP